MFFTHKKFPNFLEVCVQNVLRTIVDLLSKHDNVEKSQAKTSRNKNLFF